MSSLEGVSSAGIPSLVAVMVGDEEESPFVTREEPGNRSAPNRPHEPESAYVLSLADPT